MTRTRRDFLVITAVSLLVAAILIVFDGAERLNELVLRHESWQLDELLLTLSVLGVAFVIFAIRRWREFLAVERTVRVLQGILPICASCKRMRDEAGSWRQFEQVIREKSEAEFSHGLCPECTARYEAMIPTSGDEALDPSRDR